MFRRTYPQITNAGGLWPKSFEIYPSLGGVPSHAKLQWTFPTGATIAFRHMKQEEHKIDWQGLQICLLMWEELTHFSKSQFIFLMGSNRSTCGVRPYIRATCNPDADSWVRELVAPFLSEDGYANLDMIGQLIYFTIEDDEFQFVGPDWRDALGNPPKSLTYINADIWDNQILLEKDPGYLANLMSQSAVDRDRFLGIRGRGGSWNARAAMGKVFKNHWFQVHTDVEPGLEFVRFWDFASTEQQQKGDPDWTVGTLMQKRGVGSPALGAYRYVTLHVERQKVSPAGLDELLINTAQQDGHQIPVRWFRDPGQAGVYQERSLIQLLRGWDACGVIDQMGKNRRVNPLSAAVERGEVVLKKASWNQAVINECVGFPDADHDDIPDSMSGAYNYLSGAYHQRFGSSQARSA